MITLKCKYYWNESQPLVSFFSLFHREWKLNLYLLTMYILYCVHPEISKCPSELPNCLAKQKQKSLTMSSITLAPLLLPFLSVGLHESGTRKAL